MAKTWGLSLSAACVVVGALTGRGARAEDGTCSGQYIGVSTAVKFDVSPPLRTIPLQNMGFATETRRVS